MPNLACGSYGKLSYLVSYLLLPDDHETKTKKHTNTDSTNSHNSLIVLKSSNKNQTRSVY
jgi:hypothetical protein